MTDSVPSEPPLEIHILPPAVPAEVPRQTPSATAPTEPPLPEGRSPRTETWLRVYHVVLLILVVGLVLWILRHSVTGVVAAGSERASGGSPGVALPESWAGSLPLSSGHSVGSTRDAPAAPGAREPRSAEPETPSGPAALSVLPAPPQKPDPVGRALAPVSGAEGATLAGSIPKEAPPAPPAESPGPSPPPEKPEADPVHLEAPVRTAEREAEKLLQEAQALGTDQPALAVDRYRKVLEIDPARTDLWKIVADLELGRGALEDAARAYREFLRSHGDRADALQNLGILELHLGRTEEAQRCLEEAIRVSPSADLHYNLANVHLKGGKLDLASSAYRRALEGDPNHRDARFNLAWVLEREGKVAEALSTLSPLGRVAPEIARQRARLEAMLGGSDAGRALEVARSSSDVDLVRAVATGFWHAGELERALALLDRAVELAPQVADIRLNRGTVEQAMGRLPEAIRDYEEALRIDPAQAEAHFDLGVLSEDRGEYVQALGHYARALKANPRLTGALNNIGVLYLRVGRREKAVECFRRALETDARYSSARLNLAWTYLAMDQRDRMIEELRAYAAEVPREKRDPSAIRALQDLEGRRPFAPAGHSEEAGAIDAGLAEKNREEKAAANASSARVRLEEARRRMTEGNYEEASGILRFLLMKVEDPSILEEAKKLTRELAERVAKENEEVRLRLGRTEKK